MGAGGESLDAAKPAMQELPASLTWMQISAACMDGRKLMVINGEVRNMMAERGRGVLAVPTRARVASYDFATLLLRRFTTWPDGSKNTPGARSC